MLWRSDEEKNPTSDGGDKQLNNSTDQQEAKKKAHEEVRDLQETLNQLKAKRNDLSKIPEELVKEQAPSSAAHDTPDVSADEKAVEAAQQAVIEQARKDAEEKRLQREMQRQREEQILRDKKATEEAQKRVEEKKKEIQRLRQAQIEAERKAAAVRRKQNLADIAANKEPEQAEIPMRVIAQREAEVMQKRQQELEQRRLDDHEKLLQQQRKILQQQRRILEEQQRRAEEKQRRLKEQERKKERQRLIEQERALQRKRREKAEQEIRQLKAEQEAQRRAERAERLRKLREERTKRAEQKKQKRLAEKSAELGGGIVNVHGVQVSTEIEPVAEFSLRDLLGFVSRREKKAVESEEELRELLEEKERKKEEARLVAARLSQLRRTRRENSELGKRYLKFRDFCERKKKPLLVGFAALLTVVVGIAGVFNFFTVFEYSYNGKVLGYVNNRDNVVQITDLVQSTLSEDKNISVVIDAKKDIEFRRVADFQRELPVDDSDGVLRRLTYMGDLNVKAYGIYIDGVKVGTVKDKETAANVLQDIKDRYSSTKSGTTIEEAVIVEDIQIRRINSDFEDILPEDQMVETLCTSGHKETIHKVVVGETLADIARDYGTTEKKLLEDNDGVDPRKLEVGSSLVIKLQAPVMTVRITEVRTYDKKIKFKTEKKKDKEMYEGYSEIDQEGKDGMSTLTDRTVSINGEVVETKNLETKVKKEPIPKIVRVGTKDRPPTVGSGKFIWPANPGTYTVTSEFKWRWGRHHDGIDMGCPQGTTVLAADGGTVTYAGYMGGYGLLVIIDHQNGMESYYGHNSSLTVSTGDKVFQGQQIAYSGNTGNSTGPHIHFGIMVNGTFENPRNYLP